MNWVKQLFTTKTNLHRSLIGTMLGDCSGSPYEGKKVTGTKIGFYTDDTEQAFGVALWLISGNHSAENLEKKLKEVFTNPDRGYGSGQSNFLMGKSHRKDSYGNGAAMRAVPIGEFAKSEEEAIHLARVQCQLTHQHPDAVAGSITIALTAYYLSNKKDPRKTLEKYPKALFPEANRNYLCSLEARESVPPAINALLTGGSFDSVLLNALQYGGDVDTIAAMACGLATIKYGIPQSYLRKVIAAHPDNSRMYKMILAL